MTAPTVLDRDHGPHVVIDGRTAALLAPVLVAAREEHRRRNGGQIDPIADAGIDVLADAAAEFAARHAASGTPVAEPAAHERTIGPMTTADVADRLGCQERNVRALAERGSLRGCRTSAGWLFDRADVDAYASGRTS